MAVDTPNILQKSLAGEKWERFLRAHPQKPELKSAEHAKTYGEFLTLVEKITGEKIFLLPLWQDLQFAHHLGEHHKTAEHDEKPHEPEAEHTEHGTDHTDVLKEEHVSAVLELFKKPKFMEEDPQFWELQERLQKKWDHDNPPPEKNAAAEEHLAYEQNYTDFVYGKLDDDGQSHSLEESAKEAFRKQHLADTDESGSEKSAKQKKKDLEKIQRYDANEKLLTRKTIMQTDRALRFDEDHSVHAVNRAISSEAMARKELLKKQGLKGTELDQSYQAVLKRIQEKRWKKFSEEHPEKAAHFAKQSYTDEKSWTKDAFAAFAAQQKVVAENLAAQQKEPEEKHIQEPTEQIKQAEQTPPPQKEVPPAATAPLSEDQKIEQEIARMKVEAEKRNKDAVPKPTGRLAMNNPATTAKPTPPSPPGPSFPPPPMPKITQPIPSQGTVRPGGRVAYPTMIPFSARGQVRPSSGFRFPRSFFRRPGGSPIKPSGMPFRGGAIDGLNNGLASGANALQAGMNMLKTAENVVSALRFLSGFMGPWFPFLIAGLLILAFVLSFLAAFSGAPSFNATVSSISPTPAPGASTTIPGLTLTLSGPDAIPNSEDIQYTIKAMYTGTATITLSDTLPSNTTFVRATGTYKNEGAVITWNLDENDGGASTPKTYELTLVLRPQKEDVIIKNKVVASAVGGGGASGPIADLLPNPLPEESAKGLEAKAAVLKALSMHPENVAVYKQAEQATGIPWQVLAGKHYIEGGAGPNKSLVSGREIGTNEPDIVRGGGCSSGDTGPGKPVPVPGGCGFNTLLDSAIFAGNHLKTKLSGGKAPQNFQELVEALSKYNGGGNRNCGSDRNVPYPHCPREFFGEDDAYPMNWFDKKHEVMYLIYCGDLRQCSPPQVFQRPGVMTVIRGVLDYDK